MPLNAPPAFKERACAADEHEFGKNEYGFWVCEKCGLSRQTLTDQVGQRLLQ